MCEKCVLAVTQLLENVCDTIKNIDNISNIKWEQYKSIRYYSKEDIRNFTVKTDIVIIPGNQNKSYNVMNV